MFALLMSVYNFSWSMSSYGGAYLCSALSIRKDNFEGLAMGMVIRTLGKLLPVLLLFLVPESTRIPISTSNSSNPQAYSADVSTKVKGKDKNDKEIV